MVLEGEHRTADQWLTELITEVRSTIRSLNQNLLWCLIQPLETEWISALVRLRSEAFTCSCGGFSFVSEEDRRNASFTCPRCRASYPLLKLGSTCIPVAKGAVAYKCQLHAASDDHSTVALKVVENRHTKGLMGIKNVEDVEWEVRYDDSKKTVRPNDGAEIKPGMKIEFDFKTTGSVLRSD